MGSAGAVLIGLAVLVASVGGVGGRASQLPLPVVPPAPVVGLAPAAAHPVSGERQVVSDAWVRRTATAAGIPEPALRAYGAATLEEGREAPGCHLGWTTLAGIGWVESQHGTLNGRVLGQDGRSTPAVYGPVLDGKGGVAAVRSDDGGWSRAAGPLQFLPSTWERWGADGDGDGDADPQDLDDAALAAARYLCAEDSDLTTGTAWVAAVRSYDHDDAYVRAVYDAASAYASRTGG